MNHDHEQFAIINIETKRSLFVSKTAWIIFSVIVVLILGGLVAYSRINTTSIDVSTIDPAVAYAASEQNGTIGERTFNDTESDVVLVEYGDFQCPGCAAAHPNVKTLLEEYGDQIVFALRNFPLTSIHPNARAAAAAAEAAGEQDAYWDMHDLLYENQTSWASQNPNERLATFRSYAAQLGLDLTEFEADYASDAINKKISFDQALGAKQEVNSTPTFFLNGEQLSQEVSQGLLQGDLTALRALIDTQLDAEV
jgi:protein-disulfide isomerase